MLAVYINRNLVKLSFEFFIAPFRAMLLSDANEIDYLQIMPHVEHWCS